MLYVLSDREGRPSNFGSAHTEFDLSKYPDFEPTCPFCPGPERESRCPADILRIPLQKAVHVTVDDTQVALSSTKSDSALPSHVTHASHRPHASLSSSSRGPLSTGGVMNGSLTDSTLSEAASACTNGDDSLHHGHRPRRPARLNAELFVHTDSTGEIHTPMPPCTSSLEPSSAGFIVSSSSNNEELDSDAEIRSANVSMSGHASPRPAVPEATWLLRLLPNKFPCVTNREEDDAVVYRVGPYVQMSAIGRHEVIIESPWHNRSIMSEV